MLHKSLSSINKISQMVLSSQQKIFRKDNKTDTTLPVYKNTVPLPFCINK